jgi:hypothetical protein
MKHPVETAGGTPVRHLNIEREAPAVKQFFESLTVHPGGSEFELNGTQVVITVVSEAEKWTDAKSARRSVLIDRDLNGQITKTESLELDLLQDELQLHTERVAPLPMEYARKLFRELVAKAQAQPS